MGVSADRAEVQRKFVDKFSLTFPLVPDTEKLMIDAFGARAVLGITAKRSTFLVDPDGRIAHVWTDVNVEGHADDVTETLKRLVAERPGQIQ